MEYDKVDKIPTTIIIRASGNGNSSSIDDTTTSNAFAYIRIQSYNTFIIFVDIYTFICGTNIQDRSYVAYGAIGVRQGSSNNLTAAAAYAQ